MVAKLSRAALSDRLRRPPPEPEHKLPTPAAWATVLVVIGLVCALVTMPFLAAGLAAVGSAILAGLIVYAAVRLIGRGQ